MSVATLSPEATIRKRLETLHCAENSFLVLVDGIVGRTRFFEAMSGRPGKHFDEHDAKRLLETIDELEALQNEVGVPVNWKFADKIAVALTMRRIVKIEAELNLQPNQHLREATKIAVQQVNDQ